MTHLRQKTFFWKTITRIFMYPWPLSLRKVFKKFSTADLEFWECMIFMTKMTHWPEYNFFLVKVTPYSLSTYCPSSLCKTWRKSLEQFFRILKICKISPLLLPPSEAVQKLPGSANNWKYLLYTSSIHSFLD